jgi:hypothetical protein
MLFGILKNYLLRSVGLAAFFCFITAFVFKNEEKIFANPNISIAVVPEYGGLTISVKTSKYINVNFYMFSVEGRMVKELNITGSKKISIPQLEKGIYIYDFFSNDKRLKNGKIELR